MTTRPAALAPVFALALCTGHADWPRYFGASLDGKADATEIRGSWPDGGPPVKWTVAVGKGFGGAAIAGGHVYFLDRELGEADVMRCLDLETGEELWRTRYAAPGKLPFAGSRSVPTVAGDHVFTSGGFGHASCFARADGKLLWQHNLEADFGGEIPRFGYSTNPYVWGELVFFAVLGKETGLVAFECATGKKRWETPGVYLSTSSPAVFTLGGKEQLIYLSSENSGTLDKSGAFLMSSFDPATGAQLWTHDGYLLNNPIPVPVRAGPDRLLVTGGYDAGSQLLEVSAGGIEATVFKTGRGSQIHPPVIVGDHAYFIANENKNLKTKKQRRTGGLVCMTLAGEEKWHSGLDPNFGRGGLVYADGKLIVHDGHTGRVHLVKPDPERYTELAVANPFGVTKSTDQKMWSPPAVSGGLLVVRSQDQMKCLDLR